MLHPIFTPKTYTQYLYSIIHAGYFQYYFHVAKKNGNYRTVVNGRVLGNSAELRNNECRKIYLIYLISKPNNRMFQSNLTTQ